MKILQRAPRKALILSPAASHPKDFGNRRRVYQTCDFLRRQGYEIHFLLYPMEPDWMARVQEGAHEMRKEWDSFQIIPSSRPIPLQSPAVGDHHCIDEWWDPTIATHLSWLFTREHFDVFVVNYVFMSKALEYAGSRTVRVLETHDRFAGRKELLTKLGARIESFYTTDAEEKVALDRSDIVVAIKESEAEFYRSLTRRLVISVPFWLEQEAYSRPTSGSNLTRPLCAGFIGALNVVNVANVATFLREFENNAAVRGVPLTLEIAGDVCQHLESAHPQVRLLGRVENLEGFYDRLDVVIVPMTLSTGLKIKTGEALAFGKAVVATYDGFDGFPPVDEFHFLDSFDAVCRALAAIARDPQRLRVLEARSRISASLARRRMQLGYRKLATAISRFLPTILFLTDQPVFEEGNVQVERLAQWCQMCSGLATTVLGYLGDGMPAAPRPELAQVEIVAMGMAKCAPDDVLAAWSEIERRYTIAEVVISADEDAGLLYWNTAAMRYHSVTLDTWRPVLKEIAIERAGFPPPDYWTFSEAGAEGIFVSATALRYRPRVLDAWKSVRPQGALVVLCGPDDDDRAGLELMMAKIEELKPGGVVTLAAAPFSALERDFFTNLRACRRPAVLIAVGADRHAIALCDALGTIFGAPCLHISKSHFPLLVVRKDGSPSVCATYADLAQSAGPDILARTTSTHREDTGWSRYKSELIQRLVRNYADESALGTPRIVAL